MPPRESQSSLSRPLLSPEVQRVSSPVRKQKIQTEQSASDSESKFVQGANSELKVLKHRWSPLAITLFPAQSCVAPLEKSRIEAEHGLADEGILAQGGKALKSGLFLGASPH